MAKKEKVNLEAIKTYIDKACPKTKEVSHNGLTITVKTHLSLEEMMAFVDGAVNSCFIGEDEKFAPEVRDFAIRSGVFTMYVGLDLPANMSERYDMLYSLSDVYFDIIEAVDQTQLIEMSKAIDRRIDARINANINDVHRYSTDILSTLENMLESYSKLFDGVDADDMNSVIKAMASGGFSLDESKIVKAYLENKQSKE